MVPVTTEQRQLYQDIMLDHYHHPHGAGLAEHFAAEGSAVNPICGDEAVVRLSGFVLGYRVTHAISGCVISRAAASVLTEALKDKGPETMTQILDEFVLLVTGRGGVPSDDSDVAAFAGVAAYPARVNCALLPVSALRTALQALAKDGAA